MKSRFAFLRILMLTVALVIGAAACSNAGPGSLNIIPCVDGLNSREIKLAYEADGHNGPFNNGTTSYFYSQFGVTDRLEVGVDFYGFNDDTQTLVNAKYKLLDENSNRPAVSLGIWQVGEDSKPAYYAVGCRSFDPLRVHFGVQYQDNSSWGMLGADYEVMQDIYLIADWQTGSGRFHSLGLYWEPNPSLGLQVYYARNNTSSLRESDDFVGVYLSRKFAM